MKFVMISMCVLLLAVPAVAIDLGAAAPTKPMATIEAPPADPDMLRQGGDTIADAVEVVLPYAGSGTTIGYTDDYAEQCPYGDGGSPDVVYTFEVIGGFYGDIDLYGSSYDTKLYLYDEALNLIECNDDAYADYTSLIQAVSLGPGRYFVVVDGFGGAAGDYEIAIHEIMVEVVVCPPGGIEEGEPTLVDDYVDEHNGGCNSLDALGYAPFQPLNGGMFCGLSGWYTYEGANFRDTDWFLVTLPAEGTISITGESQWPCSMYELGPQDCGTVGVLQTVEIGSASPATMVIDGAPGSEVWFWVGPVDYTPPGGDTPQEFLYVLELPQAVAVERHSWSGIKDLYH